MLYTVAALLLTVSLAHAQQPGVQQPGVPQPGVLPAGQVPPQTPAPGTAQPPVIGAPPPAAPVGPIPTPVTPTIPIAASRTFTAKTGLLFNAVRADRVLDFETVMGYLQAALESSTDPMVRAQAEGWKIYRSLEPGPNGTVVYVFLIDPAVPGAEYGLGRILADAYPDKIMEIWKLYTTSLAGGGSLANLFPVVDGKAIMPPPVAPAGTTPVTPGVTPPPTTTPPFTTPPSTTPPAAIKP
jgi:hypothetical protein